MPILVYNGRVVHSNYHGDSMKLDMKQGVQQLADGRYFRVGNDEQGNQHMVFIDPPAPSARLAYQMERVTVESLAYWAAKEITPKNEVMRKKLAAIEAAGPTYESCRFYHGAE